MRSSPRTSLANFRFKLQRLIAIGFFDDPGSGPFDQYRGPVEFRKGINKGRQILGGPSNKFFEKKFERIFEGEALTEPWREEVKQRLQDEKRKIGGHMLPTSPSKKHSSPGDWYGCFAKSSYFSTEPRVKEKKTPVLPNMKIKPNPLGGPGYADICLNPYPSYSHEPYDRVEGIVRKKAVSEGRFLTTSAPLDYFFPNPYEDEPGPTYMRPVEIARKTLARFYVPFPKKPGGSHDGCFSKFPEYTNDPYVKDKAKAAAQPKFISGGPSLRSKYTNSIIAQIERHDAKRCGSDETEAKKRGQGSRKKKKTETKIGDNPDEKGQEEVNEREERKEDEREEPDDRQ